MTAWRRIVIKVGSAVLAQAEGGLDASFLDGLVQQITALGRETQVVLVSSGAILAGMASLGLPKRPKDLPQLQATASIGQGILMRMYEERLRAQGRLTAQVLLTQADLEDRQRYLNARNTLLTLLAADAVPVVNENDTVAVEEITFGDNDRLSALVAHLIDADALLILTDVDGFLQDGQLLSRVERITPALEALARGPQRTTSLGGMATKLQAARMGMSAGIPVVVAHGRQPGIIAAILAGQAVGTWFVPSTKKLTAHKRWLAFGSRRSHGTIIVDHGARAALLTRHTSLLPSGVVACKGPFVTGDVVTIADEAHHPIGRGLTNYSAADLTKICGKKTQEVSTILGAKPYDEVVHRDNLVITAEADT